MEGCRGREADGTTEAGRVHVTAERERDVRRRVDVPVALAGTGGGQGRGRFRLEVPAVAEPVGDPLCVAVAGIEDCLIARQRRERLVFKRQLVTVDPADAAWDRG